MRYAFVLLLLAQPLLAADATQTKSVETAIQAFEAAVTSGDAKQLEPLLTDDFELVHGTGVVESRESYVAKARGGQLSMQRMEVARFDATLTLHGDSAIQRSRARFRNKAANTELWLRSTLVLTRVAGKWKVASAQSTLLYQGTITDSAPYRQFAGRYPLEDGRVLNVKVDDGGIVIHWPNGAVQQGFPGATNEVTLGRGQFLRFSTEEDAVVATYVRENGIAWRAKRAS